MWVWSLAGRGRQDHPKGYLGFEKQSCKCWACLEIAHAGGRKQPMLLFFFSDKEGGKNATDSLICTFISKFPYQLPMTEPSSLFNKYRLKSSPTRSWWRIESTSIPSSFGWEIKAILVCIATENMLATHPTLWGDHLWQPTLLHFSWMPPIAAEGKSYLQLPPSSASEGLRKQSKDTGSLQSLFQEFGCWDVSCPLGKNTGLPCWSCF